MIQSNLNSDSDQFGNTKLAFESKYNSINKFFSIEHKNNKFEGVSFSTNNPLNTIPYHNNNNNEIEEEFCNDDKHLTGLPFSFKNLYQNTK